MTHSLNAAQIELLNDISETLLSLKADIGIRDTHEVQKSATLSKYVRLATYNLDLMTDATRAHLLTAADTSAVPTPSAVSTLANRLPILPPTMAVWYAGLLAQYQQLCLRLRDANIIERNLTRQPSRQLNRKPPLSR